MVVKVNGKPIRVSKDDAESIDKVYLTVSCLGYLAIFWIMDFAGRHLLGVSPFPFTHFIDWILNMIGGISTWLGL